MGENDAIERFVAGQERIIASAVRGLLARGEESQAFQSAFGAYLVIEAGLAREGMRAGSALDAMQRAEQRTYELLQSLGAHLEEDMST